MKDVTSRRVIYVKGWRFLSGGLSSALLLIVEHSELKVGFVLIVPIWCFAFSHFVSQACMVIAVIGFLGFGRS